MATNVTETPFTKEMKKLGFEGKPLDLFGILDDEEENKDVSMGDNEEEDDPVGDAIRAAVFALIEEEKNEEEKNEQQCGDFSVPYGYEAPEISKNLFYNKHQSERRAAKREANKVHKTTKKNWKKKTSNDEVVEEKDPQYEMFKRMKTVRGPRKPMVV